MVGEGKISADSRRWTFAAVIVAITFGLAFAIHTLVHFANLINIQGFPVGFYIAAQGAPIFLVIIAFWLASRSRSLPFHDAGDTPPSADGPAFSGSLAVGLSGTSELLSAALIVGLIGVLFTQGYDALSFGLGLLGGLIVLSLFVAPKFTEKRVGSLTSFLATRYTSRVVPECALIVIGFVIALLLSAQMQVMTMLAAFVFQVRPIDMVWIAAIVAFVAVVVFRRGTLSALLMLSTIALLIAITLPAVIAMMNKFGAAIPQASYGLALTEIGALELQMIERELADPAEMHQHARPFTNLDSLNFFGIVLTFTLGTAVYPSLLSRVNQTSNAESGRHGIAWLSLFTGLFLITLPAYAAVTKLGLYKWIFETQPIAVLPDWLQNFGRSDIAELCGQSFSTQALTSTACADVTNTLRLQDIVIRDEVLVLVSPGMVFDTPLLLLTIGSVLIGAALVASSSIVRTLLHEITTLSEPSQLRNTQRRELLTITKAVIVAVFVVGAAIVTIDGSLDVMMLITLAFGLTASALFPMIAIGSVWTGVTSVGALSSIVVGSAVFSYYAIGTIFFAPSFAETWSMISTAPDWQLEELADLKSACVASTSARCIELQGFARDAANWWGVSSSSAAVFAIPLSVLALVGGSILGRVLGKRLSSLRQA